MQDADCVAFLQWALPHLARPWAGFRKVRRQLCRRIDKRRQALGLADAGAYRGYLESHAEEWAALDAMCPITISCFYRDPVTWELLVAEVLPALAGQAAARGDDRLRALSVGCAAGEEPYTLALAWRLAVRASFPQLALDVVGSDVLETMLVRARRACYPETSVRLLPAAWRATAFEQRGAEWCLRPEYRDGVSFVNRDLRGPPPDGPFDLILCRNLLFTYWDETVQRLELARLLGRLRPGGALVLGGRERLPAGAIGLAPWPGTGRHGILRYAAVS